MIVAPMSKGPWKPLYCPAWFVQAAEVMARTNCSLKAAALEIGHPLDPDETDKVTRRRDFQEILRAEKNKYYAGVANDPTRTKSVIVGQMFILADKLIADGEFEKAANVLDKLGKLEGWTGGEGNVNIFGGLSARDIAEARDRLAGKGGRLRKGVASPTSIVGSVGTVPDTGKDLSN